VKPEEWKGKTMNTQVQVENHAEYNADGWAESIVEMLSKLEADTDEVTTEYEDAMQTIHESVLSVTVRDGWREAGSTTAEDGAEEYEILLSTGGPAARIYGRLDQYSQPESAELQVQDWFKPWTRSKNPITQETLLKFAQCFYFGE
jgi:hypothetical protein